MARPPFFYDTSTNITQGFFVDDTSATPIFFHSSYSYANECRYENKKIETKQEKLDRISKTKMLASWKKYDDKTPTVKRINQMCKPAHKITNGTFRGLR